MSDTPIKLGVIGLGRAFSLMLPTLVQDDRVRLVAATDPRPEALRQFVQDFSGRTYGSAQELCEDGEIEAVYISSPHQFHAQHTVLAARAGKHVLVEKPMSVAIEDGLDMIAAADKAGVHIVVGHSHSFDAPVLKARELVRSGAFGRLGMITALQFTDFMYRPRRPEELVTAEGGGVIFSQGAHQIDVVRLLAGGKARSVRAGTGVWDTARPSEGAYSAHMTFETGAFASLTYSGYAHFDSDEFMDWVAESGTQKQPAAYWSARAALASVGTAEAEAALKASRTYGGSAYESGAARPDAARWHQHFGMVLASCANGDIRPLPDRVMVYADGERKAVSLTPPAIPRKEVIDELWAAVRDNTVPLHCGRWALATLEVCHGIIQSARTGCEIKLVHQVALGDGGV